MCARARSKHRSLSRGRGWPETGVLTSRGRPGEGSLPILSTQRSNRIDHRSHKLVHVLQNHGVRNSQQSYAERPQTIFFPRVPAHLIDLRVNAAIEFNCEPMFEAVKIQNAAIDAELTAKLRAKSTIPQESPRGLFGFRWAPPKFANARRGDFHGGIISGPLERGAMGDGDWAMGAMGDGDRHHVS